MRQGAWYGVRGGEAWCVGLFCALFLALWGNWTRETTLYKSIEHEYNMETMRPAGSAVELGLV